MYQLSKFSSERFLRDTLMYLLCMGLYGVLLVPSYRCYTGNKGNSVLLLPSVRDLCALLKKWELPGRACPGTGGVITGISFYN